MAAPKKDEKEKIAPIIVKKIIKRAGGHHGGAWKVAYADFVTAMMAFFLLLWLLNVTTKEQKNAISNYFDPSHPKVSDVVSGAGGILGGMTVSPDGAMVTNVQPIVQTQAPVTTTHGEVQGMKTPVGEQSEDELAKQLREKEDKRFNEAADKLKAEIAASPDLKDLQKNLLIDITPEGLRIQIVDDKGRSMFPSGSAQMYDFMRLLLLKVAGVIVPLPNQASVRGHTDSNKYKDPTNYDNWNLSADRAQASRRVLVAGGLPEGGIENVMGRSDREPLEKDPAAARNRRISIILLRERLTKEAIEKLKSENAKSAADEAAKAAAAQTQPILPVHIIDDTAPSTTPAPATTPEKAAPAPAANSNAPKAEYLQPQNITPLPVTPLPQGFKAQPQVMYFNNDGDETKVPLYSGPTQSPYENKPPQIHTPVFNMDEQDAAPGVTAPVTPAPSAAPAVTPAQKSVSFGDAVPVQAAPIAPAALPPAPVLQLDNSKSVPAPVVETTPAPSPETPKVLEFGNVPPVVITPVVPAAPPIPAAPPQDLELVNPSTKSTTAPLVITPTTPAPAQPQPAAPKKTTGKQLEF